MAKFKLGRILKDKITNFEGVATGKAKYLTGCDQYCLQPISEKKGVYPDANWFDEGRLIEVGDGLTKEDVKGEKNGADYTAPIK